MLDLPAIDQTKDPSLPPIPPALYAPAVPSSEPAAYPGLHGTGIFRSECEPTNGLIALKIDTNGIPLELFQVDQQDPRFRACFKIALHLGKKYPTKDLNPQIPAERAVIIDRERKIAILLNKAIHKYYGPYDTNIIEAINSGKDPMKLPLHGSVSLFGKRAAHGEGKPLSTRDFPFGKSACIEFSALNEYLLKGAGVSNFRVMGFISTCPVVMGGSYNEDDMAKYNTIAAHAFNASVKSGNLFDMCSPDDPYRISVEPDLHFSTNYGHTFQSIVVVEKSDLLIDGNDTATALGFISVYCLGKDGTGTNKDQLLQSVLVSNNQIIENYLDTPQGQTYLCGLQEKADDYNTVILERTAPIRPASGMSRRQNPVRRPGL